MAKYCDANNKTHLTITLFFYRQVFSANLFILRDVFKFTKSLHNKISPHTANIFTNA